MLILWRTVKTTMRAHMHLLAGFYILLISGQTLRNASYHSVVVQISISIRCVCVCFHFILARNLRCTQTRTHMDAQHASLSRETNEPHLRALKCSENVWLKENLNSILFANTFFVPFFLKMHIHKIEETHTSTSERTKKKIEREMRERENLNKAK